MSVFVDVAKFVANPINTGIQRLVREILTRWPDRIPRTLVAYDSVTNSLEVLDDELVRLAIDFPKRPPGSFAQTVHEISIARSQGAKRIAQIGPSDRILSPELFFERDRIDFYRTLNRRGTDIYLIVPDFLVYLKPETFPMTSASALMWYLQLLVETPHRAFISGAVKRTFERRILRREDWSSGLILDLGADSLDLPPQRFRKDRREFVSLGTLDGRKGQEIILDGFLSRSELADWKLTFIGRVPGDYAKKLEPLVNCTDGRINLIQDASDSVLREKLSGARASIYTSTAEGYGLPPMESLYSGVPVIVDARLPALEGRPTLGQIRIPAPNARKIGEAIVTLTDDSFASRLWSEAGGFPSTTWREAAEMVASWVSS